MKRGRGIRELVRKLILILGFSLIGLLLLPLVPMLLLCWGIYKLMDFLLCKLEGRSLGSIHYIPWAD